MSRHPPGWLAWVLGATSLVLLTGSATAVWTWPDLAEALHTASAAHYTADIVWLLGAPVVGAVVASRRPANRYGWLLLSLGLSGAALDVVVLYGTSALLLRPGILPFGWVAAWSAMALWFLLILHLPFLLLLFPDGHLPSPAWRWLVRAIVALALVIFATGPLGPGPAGLVPVDNPIALGGTAGVAIHAALAAAVFGIFATIAAAGVSVFARRKRAGLLERLQLRWFAYASLLFGLVLVGTGGGAYLVTDPMTQALLSAVTLNGVFAAVGVAVLRYRLYEIDRIVSRTVSYALLTGVLVAVYLAAVLALSRLLAPFAAGSELSVAAATLTAAAVFAPARRHIQQGVDRRFNRARYDAGQVLAGLRDQLRREVELGDVVAVTSDAVVRTVQPAAASVWLRDQGAVR